jgi:hypothetical protein
MRGTQIALEIWIGKRRGEMNTLFQIASILAMLILNTATGFAAPPETAPPSPSTSYQSCVTTSAGSRSSSQTSYSFYNGCGERLYINACVTDSWGKPKLYKSGQSIQAGGRYTIYTLPGMNPGQIQWVAGPSDPGAPGLCWKKAKKA